MANVDAAAQVDGNTALHYACAAGHGAVVGKLLQSKAKLDIKNFKGQVRMFSWI